ncbi:MAG: hypothetical protein AAGA66_11185, partial [Bacteroidota bacterium]
MAAFRTILLLASIFGLSCFSQAQEDKKSFRFDGENRSEVLRNVIEDFGYYLSYKPDIFQDDPILNLAFDKQTLDEILSHILSDTYAYRIIGEYVVITPVKKNKKEPSDRVIPHQEVKTIYDTIRIEEKIITYDTQRVQTYETIFDTVLVELKIYDTIPIIKEYDYDHKKVAIGAFFSPIVQQVNNQPSSSIFFGGGIGIGLQYSMPKVKLQLAASYSIAQSRQDFRELIQEEVQV